MGVHKGHKKKESLLAYNLAGIKRQHVPTEAELLRLYSPKNLAPELFTAHAPLDFAKRVVLRDPLGYGNSVLEGKSKEAVHVKVKMDEDPELFDVLLDS